MMYLFAAVVKFCGWVLSVALFFGFLALADISMPSHFNAYDHPILRPIKIRSIKVKGSYRISVDAVLSRVRLSPGDSFTSERLERLREDLEALHGLGWFHSIEFLWEPLDHDPHQGDFVIKVQEYPTVASIVWKGNEDVAQSDLEEVIKLKPFAILDPAVLMRDVEAIKNFYEKKGYFLVDITSKTIELESHQKTVEFVITERSKIHIKGIEFVNNHKFPSNLLRGIFRNTKERSFLSFLAGGGYYKDSGLKEDLQTLTAWYLEKGYVNFSYQEPIVTLSSDKKSIFITIFVEEGESYTVGSIGFAGELLFPKKELYSLLSLQEHDGFVLSQHQKDIVQLQEKYQDAGYANVNVMPKISLRERERKIDIIFDFEKGSLVDVRKITFFNNVKTLDTVIRREFRLTETELFSATGFRRSKENVERLGVFQNDELQWLAKPVQQQEKKSPLDRDQVDIELTVKERPTGSAQLGLAVSGTQGLMLSGQITEMNLFGRGQSLTLAANFSLNFKSIFDSTYKSDVQDQLGQSFNVSFFDPYLLKTSMSISGGFDLYLSRMRIPNRYIVSRKGLNGKLGYRFSDTIRSLFVYKLEHNEDLDPVPSIPQYILDQDKGFLSSLTLSWFHDMRDDRLSTRRGIYHMLSVEVAGLGGDFYFLKWNANQRFYHPLTKKLIFRNNTDFGYMFPYTRNGVVPSSYRFFLGGPTDLKGYYPYAVGPKLILSDNTVQPLGGTVSAFSLFELEHPLVHDIGLRGFIFFDIGNVWSRVPWLEDAFKIKADYGFGFRMLIPGIGPLQFSFGFPIEQDKGLFEGLVFQLLTGPSF